MFLGVHPREGRYDLGVVPDPSPGPLRGRPGSSAAGPDALHRLRRPCGQEASSQRFHGYHPDPPGCGEAQAGEARLEIHVEQVELDLAKVPVVPLDDLSEGVGGSVEGEPRVRNAPVAPGVVEGSKATQALHGFPAFAGEGVEQVEVNGVRLEAPDLLVQEAFPVALGLDKERGALGGELDAPAVAILEGATDERLALAAVVGIGRVHVVDASLDGLVKEPGGPGLVDAGRVTVHDGQAHAAKPEDGYRQVGDLGKSPVLHGWPPSDGNASDTRAARGRP